MIKSKQAFFRAILMTILLLVVMSCGFSNNSYAAVPHLINYQGRLTDKDGKPLEGAYDLTFRIYDTETAGASLWNEAYTGVIIQKGVFSVILGGVKALNLPFDKQYYLEIQVGSEVMNPRQRITSAGYAIRAEKAETAEGIVNATGGLTVETRTSDPASPATGQLWLRTDQ